MKYIFLFMMSVCLCANQCNRPYKTEIICVHNQLDCRSIPTKNTLALRINYAIFSWGKGHIHLLIDYEGENTDSQKSAVLNYDSFLVISSDGERFPVWHHAFTKTNRPIVDYEVAPNAEVDTHFSFISEHAFSEKEEKAVLTKCSFLFIALNGRQDTVCRILGKDRRLE